MILKDIICDDSLRLNDPDHSNIIDNQTGKEFDEIVKEAAMQCNVPIALISFSDVNRLWINDQLGLEEENAWQGNSLFSEVISQNELMIIPDTYEDERYTNCSFLQALQIRFFAGIPLIDSKGYHLGLFCITDQVPKSLSSKQKSTLKVLAQQIVSQIELKQQHQMLEEASRKIHEQHLELYRLSKISNTLINIISHDLRSPLSSMKGFLNLMENNMLTEAELNMVKQSMSMMLEYSTDLQENIVKWSLLNLSPNKNKFKKIRMDLMVEGLTEKFQSIADHKENHIINEISPSLQMYSDPTLLHFLLRNLMHNALKFTTKGKIRISAADMGDAYRISVSDTGRGISTDGLKKMFRWDKRESTQGTKGEKGSGLSLILCKEIVETFQGNIEVRSTKGLGSIFTVYLKKYDELLESF